MIWFGLSVVAGMLRAIVALGLTAAVVLASDGPASADPVAAATVEPVPIPDAPCQTEVLREMQAQYIEKEEDHPFNLWDSAFEVQCVIACTRSRAHARSIRA